MLKDLLKAGERLAGVYLIFDIWKKQALMDFIRVLGAHVEL